MTELDGGTQWPFSLEHVTSFAWAADGQTLFFSSRLIITGGSAGGLLMGGVLNMRPELFHAAYVEVPFVDVINTMLDTSLPLKVGEFEEWGGPREKAQYGWMKPTAPTTM